MKKILTKIFIFSLIIIYSGNIKGQTISVCDLDNYVYQNTVSPLPNIALQTPGGFFDKVFDVWGNTYTFDQLAINVGSSGYMAIPPTVTCQAGYFKVFFGPGSDMEIPSDPLHQSRRATICQVLTDISNFVNPSLISTASTNSAYVNILVDDIYNFSPNAGTSYVLGMASAYYVIPYGPNSANPGIADNQIYKTIVSERNAYTNVVAPLIGSGGNGFYHGVMAFNFKNMGIPWLTTYSVSNTSPNYDLYGVALHEMMHALGFVSQINANGVSKFGALNNYYSRYDQFLKNAANTQSIIVSTSTCSPQYALNFSITPTLLGQSVPPCVNVPPNVTTCTFALKYNSANVPNMPLYTPNCYEGGSTMSHFEDMCYPSPNPANNDLYFLMSNGMVQGSNKRNLKPEERLVLCDMGYSVMSTYSSPAVGASTNYAVSTCTQPVIWGLNDGIVNGVYTYTSQYGNPVNIPITGTGGVLDNDAPNAIDAICVESVYNGSVSSGGGIITYTPPVGYSGDFLLRYIPVDALGNQGYITYIYGFTTSTNCPIASPCNMVPNGNFELNNGACGPFSTSAPIVYSGCWGKNTASADLFLRGCSGYCPTPSLQPCFCANLGSCTYSASPGPMGGALGSYNGSPNDAVLGMACVNGGTVGASESIYTNLTSALVPGQAYVLSFWALQYKGAYKDGSWVYTTFTTNPGSTPVPVVVTMATGSNVPAPLGSQTFPDPASNIVKTVTLSPLMNTWKYYTYTFTFTPGNANPNTQIVAFGLNTALSYSNALNITGSTFSNFYTMFDDVSVLPANNAVVLSLPSPSICGGQSYTNLAQYASPPNGTFTIGNGVTASTVTPGQYDFNADGSLPSGVYTITYSAVGSGSCIQTVYSYVTIGNISNLVTFSVTSNLSCAANQATVLALPTGPSYTWQPVGVPNVNPLIFNPVGPVTLTVTGTAGSCTLTNTVSVSNYTQAPVDFSITSTSSTSCYVQTNTLSVPIPSGGTVLWQPGASTVTPFVTTQTTNVTYSATITNSVGCSLTKTLTLNFSQGAAPPFTLSASANPVCGTAIGGAGTTTLTATGAGLNYTWQPGGGNSPVIAVTPSATTIYTVTATNSLGCIGTNTMQIVVSFSCCTQTVTPFNGIAFPTNTISFTTYTAPLAFNANVTLNSGTVVLQGAEFLFAPNVQITVGPNCVFIIKNSHLYACGANMWQGIVVQDGGAVIAYTTSVTGNTNLIEDAITAIDVTNNNVTYTANPVLEISNTTFNKNYISIKVDNYKMQYTYYPIKIWNDVFTCRDFTYTPTSWPSTSTVNLRAPTNTTILSAPYLLQSVAVTTLLAPYAGLNAYAGISLNDVGYIDGNYYGVAIGDTIFTDRYNIFDNLNYGVTALNSNVHVRNSVFQNSSYIAATPTADPGVGIRHYVTNNENMRLCVNSHTVNPAFACRFWDVARGIDIQNTYLFDCYYASFKSQQTVTVTPAINKRGNSAIYSATNRFNYDIQNNNFHNINTCIQAAVSSGTYSVGGSTYTGIYAKEFLISGNFFSPQLTGTTAISNGEYVSYAGLISAPNSFTWNNIGNTGLYINSNTVNRAYRGFYVSGINNYQAIAVNNSITLVNDALSTTAIQRGISFSNNLQTSIIATNTLSSANTTNTFVSLVYCGSNTGADVYCNKVSSAFAGFEFNSTNSSTSWKGNLMSPIPRGLYLNNSGIIGTQGSSGNPSDNQWNSTWGTGNFGTWVASGSATNSPLWTRSVTPYAPVTPSGNVSAPSRYGATGTQSFTTGSYTCGGGGGGNNLMAPGDNEDQDNMEYIANTNVYRYLKSNSEAKNASIQSNDFYDTYSRSSIEQFTRVEEELYNCNFAQAQILNSAISTTNTIEANYKQYYDLYIKYVDKTFDARDSIYLLNMAQLCPGLEGTIVYQARDLFNSIYKIAVNYTENCDPVINEGGRTMKNNESKKENTSLKTEWQIDLYPNPAQTEITITSLTVEETINVRITDLTGKILLDKQISTINNAGKLKFDLQNGIYFVSLTNNKNEKLVKKLVISK